VLFRSNLSLIDWACG